MENAMAMWTLLLALMVAGHQTKAEPADINPPAGMVASLSHEQNDQAEDEARRFVHRRPKESAQTTLREGESAALPAMGKKGKGHQPGAVREEPR